MPQGICTRLHERFRWPADQVLLVSLGIGPAPVAATPSTLSSLAFSPPRAEMLVFVESKGKVASPPSALAPAQRNAATYGPRY